MARRYTLSNLTSAIQNPRVLIEEAHHIIKNPRIINREVARVRNELLHKPTNIYFTRKHGEGEAVVDRDWDVLILLDACRYDYFSRVNEINGDLTKIISKGTKTWEFMCENFVGRELHDTVYVTANPHASKLNRSIFHNINILLDQWDEDIETVMPDNVVEAAIDARGNYPNKRLIIHFMQPHTPFLGPTADQIRNEINLSGYRLHCDDSTDALSFYQVVRRGLISKEQIRRAYTESLQVVLDNVSSLIDHLQGKIAISADHGELLGEPVVPSIGPYYGHPRLYVKELCMIPWLEIDSDDRPTIIAEEPIHSDSSIDKETVESRLRSLGYR